MVTRFRKWPGNIFDRPGQLTLLVCVVLNYGMH